MTLRVISTLTCGRISGVDVFAVHLTEGLCRLGVDARILLTNPDRVEPDPLPLPEHVRIDAIPKEWRSKRRYRRRALRDYLVNAAPCVYVPNYDFSHSPISARLPETISTIGIIHSDDPMHYDHATELGRFWNAVVAVSEKIAQTTSRIPSVAGRVHTIPYGVPCSREYARCESGADAPLRLLYVGRFEQSQKRVLDFPILLDELAKRGSQAQLTMIGDGSLRHELETLGARHIASGRLRILPTRRNDQMEEAFRNTDVFLLTSAFEGLPVAMLEAMSHAVVPIVTRVRSGVSELIREGCNGFLVEIGDMQGMADRVVELERDRAFLRRIGCAAHQSVLSEGHDTERMVKRYLELFERVISEAQSGKYRRPQPYVGELAYHRWRGKVRRNVQRLLGRPTHLPPP